MRGNGECACDADDSAAMIDATTPAMRMAVRRVWNGKPIALATALSRPHKANRSGGAPEFPTWASWISWDFKAWFRPLGYVIVVLN